MANHKSAKKAHEKSVENRSRNQSIMSKIKTFIKKVEELLLAGKNDEAVVAMRKAESQIMKGVSKGVIKKNTAARKVSSLSKNTKSAVKGTAKVEVKGNTRTKAAATKAASKAKKAAASKSATGKPVSKKKK